MFIKFEYRQLYSCRHFGTSLVPIRIESVNNQTTRAILYTQCWEISIGADFCVHGAQSFSMQHKTLLYASQIKSISQQHMQRAKSTVETGKKNKN